MNVDELKQLLERNNAVLFGQLSRHIDARIDALEEHVDSRLKYTERAIDALAKRVETDDQERAATSQQLHRHEHWITEAAPRLGVAFDPGA